MRPRRPKPGEVKANPFLPLLWFGGASVLVLLVLWWRSEPAKIVQQSAPRSQLQFKTPAKRNIVPVGTPKAPVAVGGQAAGGGSTAAITEQIAERLSFHFDLCGFAAANGYYLVPTNLLGDLVTRKKAVYLVPAAHGACLPANGKAKLWFARFDPVGLMPYDYQGEMDVKVTKRVELTEALQLRSSVEVAATFADLDADKVMRQATSAFGPYNVRGAVVLFELEREGAWAPPPGGMPLLSPYAKVVAEKAEALRLLRQGVQVLDLRYEDEYNASKIPGAISAFMDSNRLSVLVQSPTRLQSFSFPPGALDKVDSSKPVMLVGRGPGSMTAYNVATLMATRGFRDLYIFRGGMELWANVPRVTPESLEGVTVVDSEAARKLFKRDLGVVDLRNVDLQLRKMLPGQIFPAKFQEAVNPATRHPVRILPLNAAEMEKNGDKLELNVGDLPAKVLVLGMNALDWGAAKTAVMLAAKKKQVYWLRGGWEGYTRAHLIRPKRFPLKRTSAKARKVVELAKPSSAPEDALKRSPSRNEQLLQKQQERLKHVKSYNQPSK